MKKLLLPLVLCVVMINCSKKQKTEPNAYADVKGQIYNTCTDSGIKSHMILVYLKRDANNNSIQNEFEDGTFITDDNGNFDFSHYSLYKGETDVIKIWYTYPYLGLVNRDSMRINDSQVNQFFKFNLTPMFNSLEVFSNHTPLTSHSDSISFLISQDIYHKNMPDSVYTNTLNFMVI